MCACAYACVRVGNRPINLRQIGVLYVYLSQFESSLYYCIVTDFVSRIEQASNTSFCHTLLFFIILQYDSL